MALRTVERPKGNGLATVVAIADGLNDGRGGHGLRRRRSGCGSWRWRTGGLEGTDDIDFRGAGLLPGEANADEQDDEADHAVEGILQLKKGRGQAKQGQQADGNEGVDSGL